MKEIIAVLDNFDVISGGGNDVIARHIKYKEYLEKITHGKMSLIIVTPNSLEHLNPDQKKIFLQIGSNKNIFSNIFILRKFFSSNTNIKLIVAGDVFRSGFLAHASQAFKKNKIPVQFQVHADVGAKGWATFSTKHFIKFALALVVLQKAKYVRAVSSRQATNLRKLTKNGTVIQVVPVPLTISKKPEIKSRADGSFTIGILGRFQKDRGLHLIEQFLNEISKERLKFTIVTAGIGTSNLKIIKLQQKLSNLANFENLGFLESHDLYKFWEKIDCLVSLAPFESYGRSMRESVSVGIRVISTPNSGAFDLLDEVGPDWISIWTPGKAPSAEELIWRLGQFKNGPSKPIKFDTIGSEIDLLIQSWLDCL